MKESFLNKVIYQIYPRSFCDSNGDGIGDIQGIISKLDYLKDLGINMIWLSPIYRSPNFDYGYDIEDYYQINEEYGTLDDFKQLIQEAKKRDIDIMMDLVINHTSSHAKMFEQSKDINSPYHDYYVWKKGRKNNKKPPNNWDSFFTGSAWEYCQDNDLWYLHLFAKEQPDLNFYNSKVIQMVKDILLYWIKLGVKGFRCDVINIIYKDSYKNGKFSILNKGSEHFLSKDGTHNILKEIQKEILTPYDILTVGETLNVDLKNAASFINDELDMVFPFEHMNVDKKFIPIFKKKYKEKSLKKILIKWQKEIEWNANYFENHDQPRSVSRFGDENKYRNMSAKMLGNILLTLKGTPYIYQGEEIGVTNSEFNDINELRDISSINIIKTLSKLFHYSSKKALKKSMWTARDQARIPLMWNKNINGGFSNNNPWIKTHVRYNEINIENGIKDPDSIMSYYRSLIEIRKNNETFIKGSINFANTNSHILAYYRILNGEYYLVVNNMSKKKQNIKLYLKGKVLLSNYDKSSYERVRVLEPYECFIIKVL